MSVSFHFPKGIICPDAISANFQFQTRLKLCTKKIDNYFKLYSGSPRYLIDVPLREVIQDCYEMFYAHLGEDEEQNEWYPFFVQYLHTLRRKRKDDISSYYAYLKTVDFILFAQRLEEESFQQQAISDLISNSSIIHLN